MVGEGGRERKEGEEEEEGRIGRESKGEGNKIAVLFHTMLIF